MLNSSPMLGSGGNDEREQHESVTKQKVAPNVQPSTPPDKPPQASEEFDEETETSKLTGVGAW
jgi:hypothetical protein